MTAATAAINLLQNEKVQAQIADAGSVVVGSVKAAQERRAERRELESAQPKPDEPEHPSGPRIARPYGQQKLERRVAKLSENVDLLRDVVGPDAADALDEVAAVVARVGTAVKMSGNLPFGKRQKAHWDLDKVLDKLERGVYSEVLS